MTLSDCPGLLLPLLCWMVWVVYSKQKIMAEKERKYGTGHTCAVFGCPNTSKRLKMWKEDVCDLHADVLHSDCACLIPFSFHKFPKEEELKRQWISAINRKDYYPSKYAKVCSVHFLDNKPTNTNPVPSLNLGYPKKVIVGRRTVVAVVGHQNKKRKRKCNISEEPAIISTNRDAETQCSIPAQEIATQCSIPAQEIVTQCSISVREIGTQCSNPKTVVKCRYAQAKLSLIRYAHLSDKQVQYYTGLSKDVFSNLIDMMSDVIVVVPVKFKLHIAEQLLLVTMRLRLGLFIRDLAHRFQITPGCASKLFQLWIPVMRQRLEGLICWLPKETIIECMPPKCKEQQPNTTCIIDCIKVFTRRSKGLRACCHTYSSYKPHNTVEFLIAIAPHGYVMYVSPGCRGRASDKHITLDSGFLNMLRPGDEVMADRRSRIESELSLRGVTLNDPSFTAGKPLSTDEAVTTRRIASSRVHIERQIRHMKTYHIINTILPISCLPLIDDIVVVIAAFANLKKPIRNVPR